MKIKCNHCESILECDDSLANTNVACPACGEMITIPPRIRVIQKGGDREHIIATGRRSFFSFWPSCTLACVTAIVCICLCGSDDKSLLPYASFILFFILAYIVSNIYSLRFVLTNLNLKVEKGLLIKSETNIRISDIRAISIKRSLLGYLTGSATLVIGTAANAGDEIVIKDFSGSERLSELLNELRP